MYLLWTQQQARSDYKSSSGVEVDVNTRFKVQTYAGRGLQQLGVTDVTFRVRSTSISSLGPKRVKIRCAVIKVFSTDVKWRLGVAHLARYTIE